ncbi:MAG: dipeptidase [Chloroflexi bacterium]|nr:dipeptidase [Chloroflexota bacterium]
MNPYEFIEANHNQFLEDLKDWLRIPSISTLSEHNADVRKAADWIKAHLDSIGLTRTEIFETPGHPLVYGEWLGAGNAPTVLIYGHYDVQPADDDEGLWQSDPFEPVVRDGNLYARGATDDKGQTFTQVKAIHSLLQSGQMPVNVKFILEGEEESGSNHIHTFVNEHPDLLATDVVVVSDTSFHAPDQPSIVYGLRGITYLEIEVRGPAQDLHSGMYGGIVHNPAQALVEILAALHDADGRVTVPGFYDKVRPLATDERAELAKTPFPPERLERETGLKTPWGEPGYELHERLGARPTLEINGIIGGRTGEGAKTVLPARALAKVSCRLVPDQDPKEIEALIAQHVASITPETVTSEVRVLHRGKWAIVEQDSPFMQAAARAFELGFGKRPVFTREGGSIPIVGTFQDQLNAPVILMGFGLPDDNLHGPNEKYALENFRKGMQTAIRFYEGISTLK